MDTTLMTSNPVDQLALLTAYVLASVIGLHLLKLSAGSIFSACFITGFTLQACGFLIWYAILTRMPLSVAFPLAAGSVMIATQVWGYFLLGENLAGKHLFGLFLILTGLAIVFVEESGGWG